MSQNESKYQYLSAVREKFGGGSFNKSSTVRRRSSVREECKFNRFYSVRLKRNLITENQTGHRSHLGTNYRASDAGDVIGDLEESDDTG